MVGAHAPHVDGQASSGDRWVSVLGVVISDPTVRQINDAQRA